MPTEHAQKNDLKYIYVPVGVYPVGRRLVGILPSSDVLLVPSSPPAPPPKILISTAVCTKDISYDARTRYKDNDTDT